MTDLERAREALLRLSPIQAVTALIEAARREGAAEMREKAAQIADSQGWERTAAEPGQKRTARNPH